MFILDTVSPDFSAFFPSRKPIHGHGINHACIDISVFTVYNVGTHHAKGVETMRTEEGRRAAALAHDRYDKANTTPIKFKFNNKTDADILKQLQAVGNKQGYIKRLIREDIARAIEAAKH